jgi:hypothetical protein
MPQTLPNGITTPINADAYNLTADLATMGNSANVVVTVANQAARDALTLTAGLTVCRRDLGWALEIYDGTTWRSNAYNAYTPTLGASTTNPNIGAGNITASYAVAGKTQLGQIAINFGSGASGGSGSFYFSLPGGFTYAPVNVAIPVGTFTVSVGTSLISGFLRQAGTGSNMNMYWQPTATTQSAVQSSTFAWANGSQITASWAVILA